MMAAALIAAFAAGWLGAYMVRRHAQKLQLVQAPNHRSSHAVPTPTGGGIGMVAGGALALPLLGGNSLWPLLAAALLVAIVGFFDDMKSLSAKLRLAVQLAACALIVWCAAPPPLEFLPPMLWLFLVVIAGIWWINLFNFMDGIDGIAGLQAVFMLLAACLLCTGAEGHAAWAWMLAIACSALGFLLHNWPPAKIFMGDAGSTFLATMIFALALVSIHEGWLTYACWLILGGMFIIDSSVTILRRMRAGERWFEAHRSHAYQHLARRWSHRRVTLLALAINLLWLLPLAWLSVAKPELGWWLAALAYAPLVVLAIKCGAGKQ